MTALFSCAAHKDYRAIADWCHAAEKAVNEKLSGKYYDGIKYLSAQFSFLNVVDEMPPSRPQDHTIMLTVGVNKFDSADMIHNLLAALNTPTVPKALLHDLQQAFAEEGWIGN